MSSIYIITHIRPCPFRPRGGFFFRSRPYDIQYR
nr:MAG TPA: hypothetical protein [Caudoviricetes sp.]